ncbi:MAG: hypothetical protein GX444_20960 [Myxococcales bacterium]|nr:hypothetical protein [Myxococcales bacterium]
MPQVDLHIHSNRSTTSKVAVSDVAAFLQNEPRTLATITDFGTIESCLELRRLLPATTVVCGLEIRTAEGDFLVFSADEDFLRSIPEKLNSIGDLGGRDRSAVIWAHPFVNQRAKVYEVSHLPEVESVASHVDGLELFNGTMINLNRQGLLKTGYFQNLMRVANDFGLAMSGGSDAHEVSVLGKCSTNLPAQVVDAASLVAAIKAKAIIPHYDHKFFQVEIPLG